MVFKTTKIPTNTARFIQKRNFVYNPYATVHLANSVKESLQKEKLDLHLRIKDAFTSPYQRIKRV